MRDTRAAARRLPRWSAYVVPVIYIIAIWRMWRLQPVPFEWDGIFQMVAGREIWSGQGYHGWPSHFWPPLYSVLAGFAGKVLSDYNGARLVSLLAAGALLLVVYELTLLWFDDAAVALLAQLFVALNPYFVREALAAQNHMLEALFFLGCVTLLLRALAEPRMSTFALAGVVGALGGLTRYTSYILFPIGAAAILLALRRDRGTAVRGTAVFLCVAGVVSLPWWIYNGVHNGSPLSNWHYVNTGMSMMKYVDPQITDDRWLYQDQESFGSLGELFKAHPGAYFANVAAISRQIVVLAYRLGASLSLLVPLGLAYGLVKRDARTRTATWLILALFVGWTLLASQALIRAYAMTVWAVAGTILAVAVLVAIARWGLGRWSSAISIAMLTAALGLLALVALRTALGTARSYGGTAHDGYGELRDLHGIRGMMRQTDPDWATKTVMSTNPAWGYNLGTRGFIEMPRYYNGTVRDIVALAGLGPRVKRYVPRWPTSTPDSLLRADYVVFDSTARRVLPKIGQELDTMTAGSHPRVLEVFRSQKVGLYRIDWEGADSARAAAKR